MKIISIITLFGLIGSSAFATDLDIPKSITYEWTVERASTITIQKLNFTEISIKKAIETLSDGISSPLRLEVSGISEEKLNQRISIQEEMITWIKIVSIIADRIEADILITKGKVILKPQSTNQTMVEPVASGQRR